MNEAYAAAAASLGGAAVNPPLVVAAIAHIVDHAHGGLRFHDLRHCYATWLVSHGLPVNAVQHVMGHEQPSTTLNLYTHAPTDYYDTIRRALAAPADDLLTFEINNDAQTAANQDQNRADQGKYSGGPKWT